MKPSPPNRRKAAIAVFSLVFTCFAAVPKVRAQGPRCGAGVDLVVQALERMRADSTNDELLDADELLKRAAELCPELGDAWYYRSLVERKLGNARPAAFALTQALKFPSDASSEQANPFVLSTPAPGSRAVTGPATTAPGANSGPPGQRWALVIGIGSFVDPHIQTLRFTASDAQSFEDALLDPKIGDFPADHVHSLLDDQATTVNIKMQLNWLARSAGPDDVVVVYVATHGSSRDLDTAGVNYIITHDTIIGANIDPDSLYATALPMVDIANAIATRVKAGRAAIFLDTCFSGNAAIQDPKDTKLIAPGIKNAAPSQKMLDHIKQGTGRMVFAASGTDQESLESDTLKHGFFTYYLVQALRQEGGSAPLSKIFDYTQQHVSQTVSTEYKMQQNPVMSRSQDTTDFALAPSSATPASGGL
jgi:uncharacterized caspase-like protein